MIMMFSIAPLGFLLLLGFCFGEEFAYEGEHGPEHWGGTCSTGRQQSPINIDLRKIKKINLPPLKLRVINNSNLSITNNGHTVMLETSETEPAILSGGPLDNMQYKFAQLHFHWGRNCYEGSETLINNQSYSMEMHAVFYNENYQSFQEALNYSNGLMVLAQFYVCGPYNQTFKGIVKAIPDIKDSGKKKMLEEPCLLKKLLTNSAMQHYYTYKGSLTTPSCSEIVTWIVFKNLLYLSSEQLAAFRTIHDSNGNKLTHNFRPVQPLYGRVVSQNIPQRKPNAYPNPRHFDERSGHNNFEVPFTIIALGILFAIFLFTL